MSKVAEADGDIHTARKVHQCDDCENSIAPGEDYIRSVSITKTEDGRDLNVEKRHVRDCTEGPEVIEEVNGQMKFSL
jgi:hypothetical protein